VGATGAEKRRGLNHRDVEMNPGKANGSDWGKRRGRGVGTEGENNRSTRKTKKIERAKNKGTPDPTAKKITGSVQGIGRGKQSRSHGPIPLGAITTSKSSAKPRSQHGRENAKKRLRQGGFKGSKEEIG